MQFGKTVGDRKLVRIAGIHSADEWIDGVVEKLLPEPTFDKSADTLFQIRRGFGAPWFTKQI